MWDKVEFELYDFLRYAASIFLVVNSLQRLINPDSALFYMSEGIFRFFPLSRLTLVYIVMAFSLLCAFLILMDRKTFYASFSISLLLFCVTVLLVIESIYFVPESSRILFQDVALRDFEVLVIFLSICILSRQRNN